MPMYENGPHTITIYPEIEAADSRGNMVRKPSVTGVVVSGCYMHPLSSSRGAFPAIDFSQGQQVDGVWKLVCRADAPLGWWAKVEWNGLTLTVLGGPLLRQSSPRTRHISCTLQELR